MIRVEGLPRLRNVSLLGAWIAAQIDSPEAGHPCFTGWYLAGSWVLTGETRPCDRKVGYARRVIPAGRRGAPELVVRHADVDLRDDQIDGGRLRRRDLGINRWANTRWKFGAVCGLVHPDRDGQRGRTDTFLTRIQWIC